MSNQLNNTSIDEQTPVFSFGNFTLMLLLVFLTTLITAIFLPEWLPGLTKSLTGTAPSAFWFLSRGSAITAYILLWLSMMLGTGISNKLGSLWPGLPSTIELHQYTSILGLSFGIFHGLILLGDKYINFTIAQILVPFSTAYAPLAIGLGQIALYVWFILDISFYIRKVIGKKTWRAIHFASFLTFVPSWFTPSSLEQIPLHHGCSMTYLATGGIAGLYDPLPDIQYHCTQQRKKAAITGSSTKNTSNVIS